MMIMCLVMQGLSSEILVSWVDTYLEFPEQEAERLREDFKDVTKLKECMMRKLLGAWTTDPEKMVAFKQRFGISDETMQTVLMDIVSEFSVKAGWNPNQQNGVKNDYVANMLLRGAIIWLGVCADGERKKLLMDIATDSAKDDEFRKRAFASYLRRADVQETKDALDSVLAGDAKTKFGSDNLNTCYAAMVAYDDAKNDSRKREIIVSAVSAVFTKDEFAFTFADKKLAERSKEYAESPQRKAALERMNKPPENPAP